MRAPRSRASGRADLLRALALLVEPPHAAHEAAIRALGLSRPPTAAEHTELFVLQLVPYASVYLGDEGMIGGEARARVIDFFGALDTRAPEDADHLAFLLGAYASLCQLDGAARAVRRALLWEHLLTWLPGYLACVRRVGAAPYAEWAVLLDDTLRAELGALGDVPRTPLHLRAAAGLPDPRACGRDAFLDGLLAPVQSGLWLTRADLAEAASSLRLGLRVGERRFVLRALLDQDAHATLAWLAGQASDAAGRWSACWPAVTGAWWQARAVRTADLLGELVADADAVARRGARP